MTSDRTTELQRCIDLINAGDDSARLRLIDSAAQRVRSLTHDMLSGDRLRRWEETDDVLQEALVQLHRSLEEIHPTTVRDFLGLAAFHIRRALTNLARHYFGPHGMAANQESDVLSSGNGRAAWSQKTTTDDSTPSRVVARSEQWLRLHGAVDRLPKEAREVTEMLWFHGLTQQETATVLGVAERTVRRRWQRARLKLFEALSDGEKTVLATASEAST